MAEPLGEAFFLTQAMCRRCSAGIVGYALHYTFGMRQFALTQRAVARWGTWT